MSQALKLNELNFWDTLTTPQQKMIEPALKNSSRRDGNRLMISLLSSGMDLNSVLDGMAITKPIQPACIVRIRTTLVLGGIWLPERDTQIVQLRASYSSIFAFARETGLVLQVLRRKTTGGDSEWQTVLPTFEDLMLPPLKDEWF